LDSKLELQRGVGLSPKTRSFAPAATFANVQLRNILLELASTFAKVSGDRSPPRQAKLAKPSLLAHCLGWLRSFADTKDQVISLLDGLLRKTQHHTLIVYLGRQFRLSRNNFFVPLSSNFKIT